MPDRDSDLDLALPVLRDANFAILLSFTPSFGDLRPIDVSLEQLRTPRPDSFAALASRYALPALTEPGRFTKSKMRESLFAAGRAVNRKYGQRWTEGALDIAIPHAVSILSRNYQAKSERVLAVYLTILKMPVAYDEFVKMRNVEGRITKSDLEQARASGQRCGVYPFC